MADVPGDRVTDTPGEVPSEPGDRPPAPTRSHRGRAAVVVLVVAAVAASAVALDRGLGAAGRGATRSDASSGAWFCPHGGGAGWSAWVVAANPGVRPATVRFTSFGSKGVTDLATVSLAAGQEILRPVPATEEAAATSVEYFGGWVERAWYFVPSRARPGWPRCGARPRPDGPGFSPTS